MKRWMTPFLVVMVVFGVLGPQTLEACHIAAKMHIEQIPDEDRQAKAREMADSWINFNGKMDHSHIPYEFSAATPCDDGMADIFPCSNVDLLSVLPLASIGGGSGNDNWGWTDPMTGKEYALIGRTTGTSFVDISDPINPIYLGNLPAHVSSQIWRDVKVYADHAYIVADFATGHGMQIFDLTQLRNVANPPVTFTNTAHYDEFSRAHNIVINEETGYAYAVGGNDCSGGLHMIDIRTPASPTFAGCFSGDGYTHDAQCVVYRGPDADHFEKELCFSSNTDTLTIVDVTDKANPVQLSRTGYAGRAYTHQGWLTQDQARFVLDDELDEQNNGHNTRTYIWDVSDLDAPTVVDTYESSRASSDHNLYVHGRYVYQANYRSGLRILDMQDPANVTEVGFFDTFPGSDSNSFSGAWSVYPFFASGTVIVSDMNRGLFILRPTIDGSQPAIFGDNFEGGDAGNWGNTALAPAPEAGSAPKTE